MTETGKKPSKLFTDYYGAIFLFLMAGFIGLAFLLHLPIIRAIRNVNAQIAGQITQIEGERLYLSSLEQSVAAAEAISPETMRQVDEALPSDSDQPSLLVQIGRAATRNNVRIDSVNFMEAHAPTAAAPGRSAAAAPQALNVDINLTLLARNYFDVKRFLTDIEANLRLMDVLSMITNSSPEGFAFNLQLRTYVLPATTAKTPPQP